MKTANMIIFDKMEEILGDKLKREGLDYNVYIGIECDTVKNLEESGEFNYNLLSFDLDGREITIDDEEVFKRIIEVLEKKRTVKTIYERLANTIRKNEPELFEEEFDVPFVVGGIVEYLIVLAVMAIVTVLIFEYWEEPIREFFKGIFSYF